MDELKKWTKKISIDFISDKTSIDLNFSYASLNDLKVGNIDSYYNSYAFIPWLKKVKSMDGVDFIFKTDPNREGF